tara:strand:- start:58 stop:459 length:402 start_codon:yes stop_codon:yes gene_type:complete
MKFYLLIALGIILTSCDPGLSIEIINQTDSNAQVIWDFKQGNKKSHYKFDKLFSNHTNQRIDKVNPLDTVYHSFGLGTWELNNNLDSLAYNIDQITLKTKNSTINYKGFYQVKSYLKSTINDSPKSTISILLK